MSRYIDAEKFYEALSLCVTEIEIKLDAETATSKTIKMVQNGLINFPTADVEPVRHGHWILKKEMIRSPEAKNYNCSACGKESFAYPNCPFCRAIMDEEVKKDGTQ